MMSNAEKKDGKLKTTIQLMGVLVFFSVSGRTAESPAFMETGSLRFSHELMLEGVFHRWDKGWNVQNSGLNKRHTQVDNEENPWKSQWGQRLLTEVASRLTEDVYGRVLFEAQGEYADRLWRPVNINHHKDQTDHPIFLRQAEAQIKKEYGSLRAYTGVGHNDWRDKGDYFGLYPESFPDSDYLGSSGYFGFYPQRWAQDQFLNISQRRVPTGVEGDLQMFGLDAAVAWGDELAWGFDDSRYGRLGIPVGKSKFTFVYQNEDDPTDIFEEDQRDEAYALSWAVPFEAGHKAEIGVVYEPRRAGEPYKRVRAVPAGSGLLGSSVQISEKTSIKEEGLGTKGRFEFRPAFFDRLWYSAVEVTYLDVLAGNKEQLDFALGTDIFSFLKWDTQYTYRRPVEGPIPFLFEGTPTNIGAVVASPRGPESPFNVDWTNREAVFVLTTLWLDPTPGSNMFTYDPHQLAGWNLNKDETSGLTLAFQHRASDYRTATDRQYYYDEKGDIVWEPAAHNGAWASDGFLHEFRILADGKPAEWGWSLGFAGGQAPAQLGLAYSLDASDAKPITEYYSIEGRLLFWPMSLWGHYGTGVWGPEVNTHPFFGKAFDRLWGVGLSYNITPSTTWDVAYLTARQDDSLFVSPDLGSYEEIRTVFSHRFGFQLQFLPY